jgi:ribA/ribD-fused uncharacterized protein
MNYKEYIKHNDKEICGFFDDYRFLSNYHLCPVWFEGLLYPATENAFMAAKTLDLEIRKQFLTLLPKDAKQLGRKITLRPDWEQIKYDVMLMVNMDKYYRNPDLREKLLSTGDKYLEETNHWNDLIWGTNTVYEGQNNLGKILMNVRTIFKSNIR